MLKIFVKPSCRSSRMAKKWLEKFHINYRERKIKTLTREELIHLVSISEFGFEDIIVGKGEPTNVHAFIMNLSFVEAIDFILENPSVLRSPLIVEGNKLQAGYNEHEMRKFIPHEKRKMMREI